MASQSNPLLHIELPIQFYRLRAEHVETGIRDLLAQARARLNRLAGGDPSRSSTTPRALWTS